MQSKDELKQLEMKEWYNNLAYYKAYPHKFFGNQSKYTQNFIQNVLQAYYPKKNEKVLDMGCGWGNISLTLQKEGIDVIGLDYSDVAISICKSYAEKEGLDPSKFVCRDATDTKIPPESFDVVYCADLVEHLYPLVYLKMVKEAHRVLKIGGRLIIYTPNPAHIIEILKKRNVILKKDVSHVDFKTMAKLRESLLTERFSIEKESYLESHIPCIRWVEKRLLRFIPLFRRRNLIIGVKQHKEGK